MYLVLFIDMYEWFLFFCGSLQTLFSYRSQFEYFVNYPVSLVSIRFSFIIPLGHSLLHVRLFDWSVGPSVLLRRILILICSFVL